jgi:hypothetical protein
MFRRSHQLQYTGHQALIQDVFVIVAVGVAPKRTVFAEVVAFGTRVVTRLVVVTQSTALHTTSTKSLTTLTISAPAARRSSATRTRSHLEKPHTFSSRYNRLRSWFWDLDDRLCHRHNSSSSKANDRCGGWRCRRASGRTDGGGNTTECIAGNIYHVLHRTEGVIYTCCVPSQYQSLVTYS